MTTNTTGAPAPIETAFRAVSSAYDATSLIHSSFTQLSALFTAISAAADPYSQVKNLASLGSYLAYDWANLHDCQREELETRFNELRALLKLPVIEEVRHVA